MPGLDTQVLAQLFDILCRVRHCIVGQIAHGDRAAATTLIEQYDAKMSRIEKTAILLGASGSGSTVQDDHAGPLTLVANKEFDLS